MVDKRAAIGRAVERPADRVDDKTGPVLRLGDFPQLLDADRVGLRAAFLAQLELLAEALGQRAAAAFGEERLASAQLDPRRVARGALAVLADPHVAGGDAPHP